MLTTMLAAFLLAAPSTSGVRLDDIVTTHYENSFDGLFESAPYPEDIRWEADATLDELGDAGLAALGFSGTLPGSRRKGDSQAIAAGDATRGADSVGATAPDGAGRGDAPDAARIRAAAEVGIDLTAPTGSRSGARRTHASRTARGSSDSSPTSSASATVASDLAGAGSDSAAAETLPRLTSLRAIDIAPGRVDLLAVGVGSRGPSFVRATYFTGSRRLEQVRTIRPEGLTLFVSLRDLTLHLRDASGEIHLVNPVGAGGYVDDRSGILMTPLLLGALTRTPGRAWMDPGRYRTRSGGGAMMASRTHPDYYEGLPFIRLRRFDDREDLYGIHGPIAQGGTFPIDMRRTARDALASMARTHQGDPQGLYDALDDAGLIDRSERLVRGRITNGCLRQRARDLAELFALLDAIPTGVPVTVSYASDPDGVFHPFPYESRRFAIATGERDEEGMMVMYTAATDTQAAGDLSALPYPDGATIARLDKEAGDRAFTLARGHQIPSDLRRLLRLDVREAAALDAISKGHATPAALAGSLPSTASASDGALAGSPGRAGPDQDFGARTQALLRDALARTRPAADSRAP